MYLLGTGKQRAGKTARVLVGGTALTYSSWDITFEGDDLETTNFESWNTPAQQTYKEGILGPIECSSVRFGGDWDAGTNPFGSPPGLYPRDDLASVSMYESRLDATFWSFQYIRVRSANNSAKVGDKVLFDVSGKSQGPFTFPVASV